MKYSAKVESSAINNVAYDTDSKVMTITFKTSGSYDYPDVPQHHYDGIVAAESVGKYFNKYIKQYSAVKRGNLNG